MKQFWHSNDCYGGATNNKMSFGKNTVLPRSAWCRGQNSRERRRRPRPLRNIFLAAAKCRQTKAAAPRPHRALAAHIFGIHGGDPRTSKITARNLLIRTPSN